MVEPFLDRMPNAWTTWYPLNSRCRRRLVAFADQTEPDLFLHPDRPPVGRHRGGLDAGEAEALKPHGHHGGSRFAGNPRAPVGPANPIAQRPAFGALGQIDQTMANGQQRDGTAVELRRGESFHFTRTQFRRSAG